LFVVNIYKGTSSLFAISVTAPALLYFLQSQHRDIASTDGRTYDLSGTKMTCMDVLMQHRHGCLRAVTTVDVQGCTNALKDRMSEKGHPEHKKAKLERFAFYCLKIKG